MQIFLNFSLQKLFQQEQEKSDRTDEEIIKLIEFSLFMAEMFYRIRLADDKVSSVTIDNQNYKVFIREIQCTDSKLHVTFIRYHVIFL